jgi:hypothetical protein
VGQVAGVTRRTHSLVLAGLGLSLAAAVSACSDSDTPSSDGGVVSDAGATVDAGAGDAGASLSVKVGTGVDAFEPLVDGQMVSVVLGPQARDPVRLGGFHIWGGVKTVGLDPSQVRVQWKVLAGADRAELASAERNFRLQPFEDGHVAFGIAAPIMDCCGAAGTEVILWAHVADASGASGEDEVRVRVPAGTCRDAAQVDVCR